MGFGKVLGTVGMFLKRNAPTIATGAGVAGVVVSTVWCCKRTVKAQKIIEEANQAENDIQRCLSGEVETKEEYTEEDAKKDRTIVKTQKVMDLVKCYALPGALGAASIGLILWGHTSLLKGNTALSATVTGLTEAFNEYRARARKEVGEEKDREWFTGVKTEERVFVDDQTGEVQTTKHETVVADSLSIYAKEFAEGNPNFNYKSHMQNLYFLIRGEKMLTDRLHSRGHVFLNEVYEYLRLPKTYEGQFVGWVDGNGDSFVDFGIQHLVKEMQSDGAYLNDTPRTIRLDFNVDGDILYIFQKSFGDNFAKKLLHKKQIKHA